MLRLSTCLKASRPVFRHIDQNKYFISKIEVYCDNVNEVADGCEVTAGRSDYCVTNCII
jgi:hypothetical protein